MQTVTIREKLHEYIDNSDEKLLKLMFALAKEYNDEYSESEFTAEDIKIFNERREEYLNGKGKSYTWEEVKQQVGSRKQA